MTKGTQENTIAFFEDQAIRRLRHEDERRFSVVDVVGILSGSTDGRKYWNKLKQRMKEEGSELVTNCNQLKFLASDGKKYLGELLKSKSKLKIKNKTKEKLGYLLKSRR